MLLFSAHPTLDEGSLSRLRSKLVSKDGLAVIAKRFDLGSLLQLGTGERKSGGRHRDSILADAVEAIAGAILVETDFGQASAIVSQWFVEGVASLDITSTRDAKTLLQEWLQGKGYALPQYTVVSVTGEDHNQQFEVSCHSDVGDLVTYGRASSRKKAEQAAAHDLLEILIND
jgi:ribonuclease-3